MKVKNHQELIVWQKAMDLVEDGYKARNFPREEVYALPGWRSWPFAQRPDEFTEAIDSDCV